MGRAHEGQSSNGRVAGQAWQQGPRQAGGGAWACTHGQGRQFITPERRWRLAPGAREDKGLGSVTPMMVTTPPCWSQQLPATWEVTRPLREQGDHLFAVAPIPEYYFDFFLCHVWVPFPGGGLLAGFARQSDAGLIAATKTLSCCMDWLLIMNGVDSLLLMMPRTMDLADIWPGLEVE